MFPGRPANRSPLPSSAPFVRHHDAVGGHRVELDRTTHVLESEPAQADDLDVGPVLYLVPRGIGQHHAAGYREGLDTGGDIHRVPDQRVWLDDHLANVDADAHRDVVLGQVTLDLDGSLNGHERAREHAHTAVAEPLHDRPAEGVVVTLDRTHVPVALVHCQALIRLEQSRIADHISEHHRDEAAIEVLLHRLSASAWASSMLMGAALVGHVTIHRSCARIGHTRSAVPGDVAALTPDLPGDRCAARAMEGTARD